MTLPYEACIYITEKLRQCVTERSQDAFVDHQGP